MNDLYELVDIGNKITQKDVDEFLYNNPEIPEEWVYESIALIVNDETYKGDIQPY